MTSAAVTVRVGLTTTRSALADSEPDSPGATSVRFKAVKAGSFTYLCSVPGHRQMGMEGQFVVAGKVATAAPVAVDAAVVLPVAQKARSALIATGAAIAPAATDAVSIARDPADVPAALRHRLPQTVKYRIETVELNGKLDDGTTFNYWTFGSKVPGPMLRVRNQRTVPSPKRTFWPRPPWLRLLPSLIRT